MKNSSKKFNGYSSILFGCMIMLITSVGYMIPFKTIEYLTFWDKVTWILVSFGGILFITGGVGILNDKRWARFLTIIMCFLLFLVIGRVLLQLTIYALKFKENLFNMGIIFLVLCLLVLIKNICDIYRNLKSNYIK